MAFLSPLPSLLRFAVRIVRITVVLPKICRALGVFAENGWCLCCVLRLLYMDANKEKNGLEKKRADITAEVSFVKETRINLVVVKYGSICIW